MDNLSFYPRLTDAMREACGLTVSKYEFFYFDQDKVYNLTQKGSSTIKLIADSNPPWSIERGGVAFTKTVSIAYPRLLFGINGIACSNASIGICLLWTNKTLTQTGCLLPDSDIETETGRTCYFNCMFQPGTIKGDLELSIILYIKKKADTLLPGEDILINEEGAAVGEVETVVLDCNSTFMEFPIEEVNAPDEPLWWVSFSQWEDPRIDLFDRENICLYLNVHYQACPLIGEKIKNIDLLIDILSTTYLMIFQKIEE